MIRSFEEMAKKPLEFFDNIKLQVIILPALLAVSTPTFVPVGALWDTVKLLIEIVINLSGAQQALQTNVRYRGGGQLLLLRDFAIYCIMTKCQYRKHLVRGSGRFCDTRGDAALTAPSPTLSHVLSVRCRTTRVGGYIDFLSARELARVSRDRPPDLRFKQGRTTFA